MMFKWKRVKFYMRVFCLILPVFFSYTKDIQAREGYWSPKLNFDIEGVKFSEDISYVAGFVHGLVASGFYLTFQGKANYFCKPASVNVQEVIELLNEELSGTVTAEQVDAAIAVGLMKKYPCTPK